MFRIPFFLFSVVEDVVDFVDREVAIGMTMSSWRSDASPSITGDKVGDRKIIRPEFLRRTHYGVISKTTPHP
jgi:hypothetical protein